MRLLGCFSLVACATFFGGAINHGQLIWVADGVLLAYLLLAPRKLWPAYLVAGFFGHVIISPIMHGDPATNLLFMPHDVLEVSLAAHLLRRRSTELPNFTNAFYLLRFTACALIVAPVTIAFAYSIVSSLWLHTPLLSTFSTWFIADSLGILVTTPAFVAVFRSSLGQSAGGQKNWLIMVPILGAIALLLCQNPIPGPPLLFPLLIFVLLRFGLGWASLFTLATAAIGAWATVRGIGPFSAPAPRDPSAAIRLQVYVISIMAVLYSISIVIENLRATERRLQQIANLHALVAENSRDVILLVGFEGGRNFISSPDRSWGGWSRDEIMSINNLDLVHPDDRTNIFSVLNVLRTKNEGAMIEVRFRRKDSTYAWIEAALRAVRDPISHLPTGVLASIREITERKHAEQQLEDAYHAVEALSVTDPLTGLANRRRFDQALAAEWRRALREQNPLSLLLIDADHFKNFNDTYGHPSGDSCLKQIANAVLSGATRASDLAARIGGEEFVVLLPNTSGDGARNLASHICEIMRSREIPHSGNPFGIATVSVGCATVVPQPGQSFSFLVDLADQALYAAKHAGRNCIFPPGYILENEMHGTSHDHFGLA
jgi:diguanylate cyclase (GGDEF)-like protein/PAS domain S-box-containing protein